MTLHDPSHDHFVQKLHSNSSLIRKIRVGFKIFAFLFYKHIKASRGGLTKMQSLKISELKKESEIDENGRVKTFYVIKSSGHKKGLKRRIGQTSQFEPVPKSSGLRKMSIIDFS